MKKMVVSVIGMGYIGLPTAAMIASKGIQVLGVDKNEDVVQSVNEGLTHIVEPGLNDLVKHAVTNGFLKAFSSVQPSDVFLIAVPTPFKNNEDTLPEPDLNFIYEATKSIADVLESGNLIILESTSPVGTSEQISKWLSDIRPDLTFPHIKKFDADVNIAYCPERVLPGNIINEIVENDRIIGGISSQCSDKAIDLYKIFVKGECITTDSKTAEMAKLTENSCRDVQIAFANELSIICDKLHIDVWELIDLANRHPRINILQPGPGVGGHCIAVDPWFIVSNNKDEAKLIRKARIINDSKPDWVVKKVEDLIHELLAKNLYKKSEDITICCYGLSFKPDIDDLRESPSLEITRKIAEIHDGQVLAVEPNIEKLSQDEKFLLTKFDHANDVADIKVMLVDHEMFKNKKPKAGYIIDTKGIWR